jgi:hypothetical protein
MGRGNKAGKVKVKGYTYYKKVKGRKTKKRVHVPGYRRSAPGGKKGSQKKR